MEKLASFSIEDLRCIGKSHPTFVLSVIRAVEARALIERALEICSQHISDVMDI